MKLSNYCTLVRPYIESCLESIKQNGQVIGYNNKEYTDPVEFLDDSVVDIVEYAIKDGVEKDIDMSEAFRQSGIVQGYLDNTGMVGKVVKSQNPLKGLFK